VAESSTASLLPQRPNLHWLGLRTYPSFGQMAGWDVGIMPFALNRLDLLISPTKRAEYLAAGLPVVATPVRDVVTPYGDLGLVRIASGVEQWVGAVEAALAEGRTMTRPAVDAHLASGSWDTTWAAMSRLVDDVVDSRPERRRARGLAQGATR
jgi:UDP-galactopyranose mutase